MPDASAYEIRVGGVLDRKWAAHFAPFELTAGTEETLLTGVAHDQAELFGVLLKIRDLGLRLISVNPAAVASPHRQDHETTDPGIARKCRDSITKDHPW